ncbi:MAG: tRNA epoxyqueuosine(34) reductase QueG [SAR202 cluster bacterium Io17-Chloro-G3]|nr:MAG: tRNA epoxyqueuosine(34) reductase QueG [SAR202 cluster bacterium Io17-Chloro-G3]
MEHADTGTVLKKEILAIARSLGFDSTHITSVEPFEEYRSLAQQRLGEGYFEGMNWLTRERFQRATDPRSLLLGARSIIVVALSYLPSEELSAEDMPSTGELSDLENEVYSEIASEGTLYEIENGDWVGKIARYARWTDYHQVMKAKLQQLAVRISNISGRETRARVFVDDGALLERAVAERAGLGWFGKNTNILTQTHGSWVFLGALITDLELEPDQPLKKTCGDCIRCIPACPTGAIVAPYTLDARRCISYLTIEHRGVIPYELRELMGDWVFGCDVCQEVCPVNTDVRGNQMPELKRTGFDAMELIPLLYMTQGEFSTKFRDSPIKRAKLVGMQRNACIALGNIADTRAVTVLGDTLQKGVSLVRGHAAWALGRIGGSVGQDLLTSALKAELDEYVRSEIEKALGSCDTSAPVQA